MNPSGKNGLNIHQSAVEVLQKWMTCTEMEAKSHLYFMRIKKFVMRKKKTRYFKCEQCEKK